MSTLKPNRLEIVKEQLEKEKIPSDLIPKTINECDKEIYHLLFVNSTADYNTKEFKHSVVLKKFNQMSFEVNKNQFPKLGYTNVHILHDPVIAAEEEAKAKAEKEKLDGKLRLVNSLNKDDLIARANEDGIEVEERDTVSILKQKIKKFITG